MSKERKFFGTDGIRGKVNKFPLLPKLVQGVGIAAVSWFVKKYGTSPIFGIGRDTRNSGALISSALTSGALAAGAEVVDLGILPTPGVAHWTKSQLPKKALGVVISASHNPFSDNGIKLFTPEGYKLSDRDELEIEELLRKALAEELPLASPEELKELNRSAQGRELYLKSLSSLWPKGLTLEGKFALDTANGAAYQIAPELFQRLGFQFELLSATPDGKNINRDCGALHPQKVAEIVRQKGLLFGLALDGDADRLLAVDEEGNVVNGDTIIAICAPYLQEKGELKNDLVVTTVMSNYALDEYLNRYGIKLYRTPVGDRYVSAELRKLDGSLGGEESGHIIFSNYSTTGDGLLTALQLMRIIAEKNQKLSELAKPFTPYPQIKKSVPVKEKRDWLEFPEIAKAIERAERQLEGKGRVLVRYSGTENKARIMLEGPERGVLEEMAEEIAKAFAQNLG